MPQITINRPDTYKKQPKNCEVCGESFNGTKSAKFCSNKCRQKNKRGKK